MFRILFDNRDDLIDSAYSTVHHDCYQTLTDIQTASLRYIHFPNSIVNVSNTESFTVTWPEDGDSKSAHTIQLQNQLINRDTVDAFLLTIRNAVEAAAVADNVGAYHFQPTVVEDGQTTWDVGAKRMIFDFKNTNLNELLGFDEDVLDLKNETYYSAQIFDPWANLRQVYIFASFYTSNGFQTNFRGPTAFSSPWAIIPMDFSEGVTVSTSLMGDSLNDLHVSNLWHPISFSSFELNFYYRKRTSFFSYPFLTSEISGILIFTD